VPTPPASTVLLKDIVIPRLPSPYYHFEYDPSGLIRTVSFASGFTTYDVTYVRGRIAVMTNNTIANRDRLEYVYDNVGRVSSVRYVDSNGVVFAVLFLSYDGEKLTGIERDRRVDSGFIVERTVSFSYDADGNLLELTEHYPRIEGRQDEATTVDHFEQYDAKINVDAFSLLHDEFFDHLVLLPDVRLQKGNPGRVTRTGDGLNFTVDYTYAYDGRDRPLTKSGDVTITNGPTAGQKFQTLSEFSYF
jgi:hypothetical protein